ncbi:alpha/beta hydrolase [Erythrobacter sp. THAF29]|uniref:alpha/beta hydrolase n=1 Tax=Erythrobacter sp. THAF29 TaxID=2587851 RepID=UPI0012681306|nr:alpha/beta hydrolase [Erythrobacter sp. THAF29]QFT76449.1 Carboxylesterase NlhH [Erythrobacter sp. THAF29]
MIWWILGGLVLVVAASAIALQVAIARDGPAVLSAVDRMSSSGDAELKATISTGEHPQQKLLVWGPGRETSSDERRPVLVFVHGGSWRSGDPASYDFIGRAFVPKGFVVVLAGYRLGDAGKYPAMLEDTAAAIGWAHREIAQYGGDPEQIVLAGHSAGAYNVVMAALDERWLAREGLSPSDISGVVGLAGPYDFFPFDSESTIAAFGDAPEPVSTQPIAHVRADAPPMLLIHGEKDTLVKPRNTRALAQLIEEAGGAVRVRTYAEMEHNDPLISLAAPWRSNRDVADLIAAFAHEVTKSDTKSDTVSVPVQAETR